MTKIELLRKQMGLSRNALAKKAGLQGSDIKRAEECDEMFISETLAIAKALKVKPMTIRIINSNGCFAREKKRW